MDTMLQSGLFAKSLICCVCFLYENLRKYEGFRPLQGFIFVEIFVIEF